MLDHSLIRQEDDLTNDPLQLREPSPDHTGRWIGSKDEVWSLMADMIKTDRTLILPVKNLELGYEAGPKILL